MLKLPHFFKNTDITGINRSTYITLLIALISAMLWLFMAQISSAVILQGSIKVYKNKTILQHPEGGKIGKVFVTEGQVVKKDDLLIELENPNLQSSLRNLERQNFSEQLRSERLKAEMNYPQAFEYKESHLDSDQLQILLTEKNLFDSRRKNLLSQLSSIREQIQFLNDEIISIQRTIKNDQIIIDKNKNLADKGFVSNAFIVNAEQTLNQHEAELARARQRISELSQRTNIAIDDFKKGAAGEMRATNEKMLEIEEKIKPTADAMQNLQVKSPVDGTVVNLFRLGIGSVLGAKEVIAEIVPSTRSLILEASLPSNQVSFVKPGQLARVKIQQLKQLGLKDLKGKVDTVSADTLSQGATGNLAYLVQISIDQEMYQTFQLKPGMPAEVFIQAGTRTPFEYLSMPFSTFLDRAVKEP
jgi:HlyD family type I secretion membrane fusion protein